MQRRYGAMLAVTLGVAVLLWWLWPRASDDAGLVQVPPAATRPIAPPAATTNIAAPVIAEERRGLDPVEAPGAVKELPESELIARSKEAPRQYLTPEEIAAGRKSLEQ